LRVAALYDVHGMRAPLEAVLADVQRANIDSIVFGGDLLEGPLPRETLELVRSVEARFVRGNCEDHPSRFVRKQLDADALDWLATWPLTLDLDRVLYCHSLPRSNEEIVTDRTPDRVLRDALADREERLVVAGHTHHQFRNGRYVNAGSVGMPYEDEVAAFWAVVDDGAVEFRKTPFDAERAAVEIRATGWPGAGKFVPENLLEAPSRASAIEFFESQRA